MMLPSDGMRMLMALNETIVAFAKNPPLNAHTTDAKQEFMAWLPLFQATMSECAVEILPMLVTEFAMDDIEATLSDGDDPISQSY
jgi:hypothetical protein